MKKKKHKKDKDIYEKFLWLREFVDWQENYKSNLDFKYYKWQIVYLNEHFYEQISKLHTSDWNQAE